MGTYAERIYRDSEFGELQDLPKAGTPLEHPLAFDAVARELHTMALRGMVEIVERHQTDVGGDALISAIRFRKVG